MKCHQYCMAVDLLLPHPLFLSENEAERELKSLYFPLGLLYLAPYVREHGYSPFEALNDLDRRDIPMLDVRDGL